MTEMPPASRSTVIPCLRYRDCNRAIEWLCQVFGFEKHAVYHTPDGHVAHAQLVLNGGMLMLGSVVENGSPWGAFIRQPDQVGGFETQGPCLVVTDADAVYERAKAAGASIVIEIKDEDYGGRGFTCRDLEGRLWAVGTYNPWAIEQS